jgi:type IV pilus assembly protein PilV
MRHEGGSGPPDARGFSLIEVLVSMAVLAVGLVLTAHVVGYTIRRSNEARRTTVAQLIATEVLERLRFEVRYDAEPDPSVQTGLVLGASGFDLASAWRAERLPWRSSDTVAPGAGAALASCNPPGAEDGESWDVGPFEVHRDGGRQWVCYSLSPTDAGSTYPPLSQVATVKVLWRTAGGWAANRYSTVLTSR